jgi:uncharacterized protein YbaA (DUF1428 family)
MAYIDFMAVGVPEGNKDAYIKASKIYSDIAKSYGATAALDAWGDDVPDGKITSFPMAVKKEAGEVVAIGYVVWPSKAVRDAGQKKMMEDPRMADMGMPFDGKRMIHGGFEIISQV